MTQTLVIDSEKAGVRLDKFLRKAMPHTPLAMIFSSLRTGKITVGGKKKKQDYRLVEGDVIEIRVEGEDVVSNRVNGGSENVLASNFFKKNFRVVFEDDDILICDKPVGIVVHSGAGHSGEDSLISLAQAYLSGGGKRKASPALVHRLDRDTSGLILISKTKAFVRDLTDALDKRESCKTYAVLCHGRPDPSEGLIDVPLGRSRDDEMMRVVPGKAGQSARTKFKTIQTKNGMSLVEATLLTGRTHQIRVHFAYIKCPVVGDRIYGNKELDAKVGCAPRLHLHAMRLSFVHPRYNREVAFEAPVPKEFDLSDPVSKPNGV